MSTNKDVMKKGRVFKAVVAIVAVFLTYVLFLGLSLWREAAMRPLATTGNSVLFIIQIIAILIILSASLMTLHWFLYHKMRPNSLVSGILLISGCLLLVAPFYPFSRHVIRGFFIHFFSGTLLSYAIVFVSITGIIGLVRNLYNRKQRTLSGGSDKRFLTDNRVLGAALSLFAVLLMLAVAYGFDLVRATAWQLLSIKLKILLFTAIVTAIQAALMSGFIVLNWLINIKIRPLVIVSGIIFLGGFALLIFPFVTQLINKVPSFPNSFLRMNFWLVACAFIMVIGGAGILRKIASR